MPKFALFALLLIVAPWAAFAAPGASMLQGVHGDKTLLPKSCRACHRGMSMSISGEEQACLVCHGDSQGRQEMSRRGYLKSEGAGALRDIGAELRKPYNHPVLATSGVHQANEALPEELVNAARHAECVDCHEPHQLDRDTPFRGLSGKRVGNFTVELTEEYELCYKCHAESANLPSDSSNKHAEFSVTNTSFHPIEGEGRNAYVISLKTPYATRQEKPGDISVISCRDCHGNDDSAGPKGPHGSNYRGLLVNNYEMEDERPESEFAYALCYKCHSRTSILGNESFPYHALHIKGNVATGKLGTTCFSCHDAHGSNRYQFLISFNKDFVQPNADNKLEFNAQGVASRHGSCLLNCHGVEHNPKSY
ncbi:cytochrome c3 family protein [Desulfuromonas carbonis]|nr:octaheme cytochrome c [Desulfuromonas sp. DDH964]